MDLIKNIRKLRILALLLFLTPAIGLIGSLIFHNYLVNFNFIKSYKYNFSDDKAGQSFSVLCDDSNKFCTDIQSKFEKFDKLENCYKHKIIYYYTNSNGDELKYIKETKEIINIDEKVYIKFNLVDEFDEKCIANSDQMFWYKIFPSFFESISVLKTHEKTTLGTSEMVNPFIYGETSISNIVKRFPINFFFKPILYLTSIFMFLYWFYYNLIFRSLVNLRKNYYFFYFGTLSSIFLFLHVFFLGWTFESEFLTKLRRTFVIFFILFEILSQAFLIRQILNLKNNFKEYFNIFIISLKLIFVIFICSVSIFILVFLIFYNFTSKIDYILEWNYFLILLLFYFLSFLMWKRKLIFNNPTTT